MHKMCLVTGMAIVIQAGAAQAQDARLIEEGRRLFFEETFNGNGRTCGTCHPISRNFTVDPEFIATLPDDDPLFVAEFNPDLAELEDPSLMRNFGLILENLAGFENPPVFRGVPHTLGMRASIAADPAQLGPDRDAAGWSGDGAPGAGTIRDFLEGAITQHFPRTLNRVPGVDFRLPTQREKLAVEAFMLSLGRRAEVVAMADATFRQGIAERGRLLFEDLDEVPDRSCNACHANAGANDSDGFNSNFATGTVANTPGLPPDDGFGTPGDGTFNAPSLVEAASTGPFFHNNSAQTIEDAVDFYTTVPFAESASGQFGGAFAFTPDDVIAVAAMLRTINVIDVADNAVGRLRTARQPDRRQFLLRVVQAEINSSINVLTGGPVQLGPTAVERFTEARGLLSPLVGRAAQPGDAQILADAGDLLASIRGLLLIDAPAQVAARP